MLYYVPVPIFVTHTGGYTKTKKKQKLAGKKSVSVNFVQKSHPLFWFFIALVYSVIHLGVWNRFVFLSCVPP